MAVAHGCEYKNFHFELAVGSCYFLYPILKGIIDSSNFHVILKLGSFLLLYFKQILMYISCLSCPSLSTANLFLFPECFVLFKKLLFYFSFPHPM